nr:zinc finger protein 154 [Halyomorpha halys]
MDAVFQFHQQFLQGPEDVNLDEICRLCRTSRGVMSYIYSSTGVDTTIPLSTRIMSFANVQMSEGDGLPSLICHRCLYHIEKANEFKVLCEQSDALLRQYLALQTEAEIASSNNFDSVHYNGHSESFYSEIDNMKNDPDWDSNGVKTEGSDDPQWLRPSSFNCIKATNKLSMKYFNFFIIVYIAHVLIIGIRPYVCPVCFKSFTRSTNLNKHSRLHTGRKPFSCPDCDKMFASRGDLLRHSVIHTGEKPFACSICFVSFNRKDKLTRHEKLHIGGRAHTCSECPTSFTRKEELTKHIQFHHFSPDLAYFNETPEPQDLTVPSGNRLKVENSDTLDSDEPRETESMVISVDPTNWTEENGLEITKVEKTARPINLSKGKKVDASSNTVPTCLDPTKVRAFICEICHKGFRQRRELSRHSAIHTGLRPHHCPTCGKSFARSDKLKRHMRTHITKSKRDQSATLVSHPQCDICFKTLSSKHELRRHLMTHSLFKPYQCSLCASSYCRKDKLIKHIKKCHSDGQSIDLKGHLIQDHCKES